MRVNSTWKCVFVCVFIRGVLNKVKATPVYEMDHMPVEMPCIHARFPKQCHYNDTLLWCSIFLAFLKIYATDVDDGGGDVAVDYKGCSFRQSN